jgi:hypothetical protein
MRPAKKVAQTQLIIFEFAERAPDGSDESNGKRLFFEMLITINTVFVACY